MENDLISRHEAYMLIKHEAETHELPATKEAYERAALIVDQMRPANIAIMEPRTGRWESAYNSTEEGYPYNYCSECGFETGARCFWNYCPNCGAKMKGE